LADVLIVPAIFFVGQTVADYVLSPYFVGRRINLNPVWVMFALFAFGYLFAFVGLLIVVPLAAAIGVLVRFFYFLPHDGYRHIDAFDACKDVGHQIAPFVGLGISPARDLIVRRAVDVMEDGPRQSPLCHRAEIPDVVASIDMHWILY
jgi:AI-2E family transporter